MVKFLDDKYKLKSFKPKLGKWSTSKRQSRPEEVTMSRLRLGHTKNLIRMDYARRTDYQTHTCFFAATACLVLVGSDNISGMDGPITIKNLSNEILTH